MKNLLIFFSILIISGCHRNGGLKNDNVLLKELTGEKIEFEIKDNPNEFITNKKYWIKLKIENISKEKIAVTSNNGRIFISELEEFDYMFIPEKAGEMKLGIYDRQISARLCGEIEIKIKNDARK